MNIDLVYMKKQLFTAALLVMAFAAEAENKFDARSELIVSEYSRFIKNPTSLMLTDSELPFAVDIVSRSEATASASIILADGTTAKQIEKEGLKVIVATKSVLVVEGSMDDIIRIANSDLVESVSFANEYSPLLDYARRYTGVEAIHNGSDGLPQAYTGKGVITAIFDTGFYPDHVNFKDSNDQCRISNFWHYKSNNGSNVVHYDTPEDVVKITNGTDSKTSSHGTHTLGCMAGHSYKNVKSYAYFDQRGESKDIVTVNPINNKNGVAVPFSGMAKESEIIAAAGSLSDLNMMAGIKEMSDYIKASGKPGVINLSIGTLLGPRDGSDAFTVFLDEIAEETPILVAAGNDGDAGCSISGQVFKTFIHPQKADNKIQGAIDIWGSDDKAFDASLVIYDIENKAIVYTLPMTGDEQTALGNKAVSGVTVTDQTFEDAFSSSYIVYIPKTATTNNRRNIYMQYNLNNNQTTNSAGNYVIGLIIAGNDGQRIDLAHKQTSGGGELVSLEQDGWTSANSEISINSLACGHKTMAIGAWNTRNQWAITPKSLISYVEIDESGLTLDDVAGYSSYGKLIDGRCKPDFTAPGTGIISSVSTPGKSSLGASTYPCATYTSGTRSDMWGLMQGTSMATPVVAGSIALWLEADPSLTPAEIREIALNSCKKDENTAAGNALKWGAGKFDALAGLKMILRLSGIDNVAIDDFDKITITASGNNCWNVFAAGTDKITARLFNLSGIAVSEFATDGDELAIDASGTSPGIYILSVNGCHNTRVAVK